MQFINAVSWLLVLRYFFCPWHDFAESVKEYDDTDNSCCSDDTDNSCCSEVADRTEGKPKRTSSSKIALTPFGLATYKMLGDLWLNPDTSDQERILDLFNAADSWLKQLSVHHHDFKFFACHSNI